MCANLPEINQARLKKLFWQLRRANYRLLTKDEEYLLVTAYQRGIMEREIADVVIACNIGMMRKASTKYSQYGMPHDDLMVAGMGAVPVVLERFDIATGNRLSTVLLPWIHQRMRRMVNNESRVIRLPDHMHSKVNRYTRAESIFEAEHGREPTDDELLALLKLPDTSMETVRHARVTNTLSLDTTTVFSSGNGNDVVMGDVLAAQTTSGDYDAVLNDGQLTIESMLAILPERERLMMIKYHGLYDHEKCTLVELGKEFGLTRSRIHQILNESAEDIRAAGFQFGDFV